MIFPIARSLLILKLVIYATSCSEADSNPTNNIHPPSGFSIRGVSMVAPVKPMNGTALVPIVNLHANSIAIMPYAFCSPENPVIKYNHHGQWWGESDEGVIGSIQLAHEKKLTVMLKPHLWIAHGMYTGAFSLPTEEKWQLWESSYQEYMLHFATIADSLNAELFCIGTELGETIKKRPRFWQALIDTLKKTYHGKLTYAANWDDYERVPFWEKLDYIGVDAYFPLSENKTPSINELKKCWKKYNDDLKKASTALNRPVLFTEYGYRNVDYNSVAPWKENEGNQNDKAQSNAFEAFYQSFAGEKWFAGGFMWKWYVDTSHHGGGKIDFTPQNKPALKVIENWYQTNQN